VPFDARAAQALLCSKPGAAAKLLYGVRAALEGIEAGAKVC
jgi:hypothetical protein